MKKLIACLLALAMALVFVACDQTAATPAAAATEVETEPTATEAATEEPVVLEFQQWFDNEMQEGYLQSLCDEFTAQTGVQIKLLSNPYADTKTQIEASAAAGTMADIVALDGGWIYDYAVQGHLANLDELYDQIGLDKSVVTAMTTVNGITYAQPIVNFPCLMAVNQDLLTNAGIEKLPETWTELLEDCKLITDPTNNIYGFAMNMSPDNATCMEFFASFAWNSGGTILTADGKPYLADNEIFTKSCEFFKSLFDNKVTFPGMYSMTDADKVQEFVNGRVAFMPDSCAHWANIHEQAPDMNVTYIAMPHMDSYTGDTYIRVNNWAVGIAENCEHKTEAAQFIQFLLSADVNADLCEHANAFPVNNTAAPEYTDDSEAFKAILNVYMNSFGKAEFYSMPTAEALMTVLDNNLVMYIDGDYATADEMLAVVQEQFEAAYN